MVTAPPQLRVEGIGDLDIYRADLLRTDAPEDVLVRLAAVVLAVVRPSFASARWRSMSCSTVAFVRGWWRS